MAAQAARGLDTWGFYLHVPFCAARCGYCDFNTYTSAELGPGADRATYADTLIEEIRLARTAVPEAGPIDTVFFGGGTPTLIGAEDLVRVLHALRSTFGLTADAEVTTEANPDSVDLVALGQLREGGFTRVSFGVQSVAPHVLEVLERTHTPGRSLTAIAEARSVGFDRVSADLIYATPGETDEDLTRSVSAVLEAGVDHLSAYSLIVEDGTRLAMRVRRGEIPAPDDDVAAGRYVIIDELTRAAGMSWYEVSNWSQPGAECRHNLGYWRGNDWWGAGPGAHGYVAGRRWWNHKHPATYAAAIARGELPVAGDEVLTEHERSVETVMLGTRMREGLSVTTTDPAVVEELAMQGLVHVVGDAMVLTDRGRLLADAVVRRLLA